MPSVSCSSRRLPCSGRVSWSSKQVLHPWGVSWWSLSGRVTLFQREFFTPFSTPMAWLDKPMTVTALSTDLLAYLETTASTALKRMNGASKSSSPNVLAVFCNVRFITLSTGYTVTDRWRWVSNGLQSIPRGSRSTLEETQFQTCGWSHHLDEQQSVEGRHHRSTTRGRLPTTSVIRHSVE